MNAEGTKLPKTLCPLLILFIEIHLCDCLIVFINPAKSCYLFILFRFADEVI